MCRLLTWVSNFEFVQVMSTSEKENVCPPEAKRCKLSLKLNKRKRKPAEEVKEVNSSESTAAHFPILSPEAIEDTKKRSVPKNTEKCTNWALRLFNSWCEQRNERCDEKVPEGILLTDNHQVLCHWLCVSVTELRKEDGGEYTPRSIAQYIAGIQRYITEKKCVPIRLVDPGNSVFQPLHRALDNRYRELHANGVGTTRRQAEVVTLDEEEQLWQTRVLSSESPLSLLRAVFYLNGINFVLRGGDEHRRLKISQFSFINVPDPDCPGEMIRCVQYTEHGSKNRPGSSHQLNQDNKVVTQFAKPDMGDKCHVFLLELYVSKLPESALQRDIFYMKAKSCIPDSLGDPWYTDMPLGHNTLGKMLKEILKEGGINAENKSNHSLRSTAISRMYENKVPEKLIMERSGHLSLSGLLTYERTTVAQKKAVCDTLLGMPMQESVASYSKKTTLESGIDDPRTDDKIPASVNEASEALSKDEIPDAMRNMQFTNMTGCTFNFTLR